MEMGGLLLQNSNFVIRRLDAKDFPVCFRTLPLSDYEKRGRGVICQRKDCLVAGHCCFHNFTFIQD